MHNSSLADMRFRTAELALIQSRRRRAAMKLVKPTNKQELIAHMDMCAMANDQARRATAERARALRLRSLPDLVA